MKNQPIPLSKLDQRIQNLIQLICNVQAMEEALLEMKFDARKNPLGKPLTIDQSRSNAFLPRRKIELKSDQSWLYSSARNRTIYQAQSI